MKRISELKNPSSSSPMEEVVVPSSISSGTSLIKQLASCDKGTRDKALKQLIKTWLPSQPQISDEDMKKLWKGLFYCVWHADKALVQSELIGRLSSLLLSLDLPLSVHYFSVFLITMRREWNGIDGLRLDKFYLLIRRFVHCFFLLLKKNDWDLEVLGCLMGVLEAKAFFDDDNLLGNGVNYHIASVFLDELKPFLPVKFEALEIMFKTFLSVINKSQDKVFIGKVKSNVFDVLLKMGKSLLELKKSGGDVDNCKDEREMFGTMALTMGFSAKFYDLGSAPDCIQGNRKVLFSLHDVFSRLEKDLKLSGIEISFPEPRVSVDDEDEIPKLIPILGAETEAGPSEADLGAIQVDAGDVNVSANNSSKKKNKKGKKGSDGSKKKSKKKENRLAKESEDLINGNGESLTSDEMGNDENMIDFNEAVISNLQLQFEKVAAEAGMDGEGKSPKVTVKGTVSKKKRKRAKNTNGQDSLDLNGHADIEGDAAAKSCEMSAKKVRFSMKNNLVWKPHCPLPPQSLRLPPSATPRGSALKKGLSPGPIREMSPAIKKVKRKKGRKVMRTVSPAVKRLRKLQTMSI